MKLELIRYEAAEYGTFGVLFINNTTLHTVEQAWENNRPFGSCVPAGEYILVPHDSNKYGQVLCLVNNDLGVTQYQESLSKRYACLIHVANYASDVQGCIGLGRERFQNMVGHSRSAIKQFYEMVDPHEAHQLTIKWGEI